MTTTGLIISRGELGLPDLDLTVDGLSPYGVVTFTAPTLDRTYPSATPWVEYERPTHVRRTNGTYTVPVRVEAATPALLSATLDALEAAFGQVEFTVSHTYGGITRIWSCIAADIEYEQRSRDFDAALASENTQLIKFTGPHRGRVRP